MGNYQASDAKQTSNNKNGPSSRDCATMTMLEMCGHSICGIALSWLWGDGYQYNLGGVVFDAGRNGRESRQCWGRQH